MANENLLAAIVTLGSNPSSFDQIVDDEEVLKVLQNGFSLLGILAPSVDDAVRLASTIAVLAGDSGQRKKYADNRSKFLKDVGLSATASAAFMGSQEDDLADPQADVRKVLQAKGDPGDGGANGRIPEPDPPVQ